MTWLHVVVFILIALVGGLVAWCWSLSDDLEGMRDELALDTADDTYGRHHHSGSTKWAA